MIIDSTEYERIYKIINSMVLNEGLSPDVSAILFSFFGAQILKKHYDLNALPKAGIAAYQLGDGEGSKVVADETQSFHCWVEVDGWLIDFMAPCFSTLTPVNENGLKIQPRMVQKPLSNMSDSVSELKKAGDFYLEANHAVLAKKYTVINPPPFFGNFPLVFAIDF